MDKKQNSKRKSNVEIAEDCQINEKKIETENKSDSKKIKVDGSNNDNEIKNATLTNSDDDSLSDDEEYDFDEDEDLDLEDESDASECNDGEVVFADFAAFHPVNRDSDGIRKLFEKLWLNKDVDIDDLIRFLNDDSIISLVLKQVDDETSECEEDNSEKSNDEDVLEEEYSEEDYIYGVSALIPMCKPFTTNKSVENIKHYIEQYVPKVHEIHQILSSSTYAVVLNERMVNLPVKISVPTYKQLIADWKELESDIKMKSKYNFKYVVMICKILKYQDSNKSDDIHYVNPEDELFDGASQASFEFSVSDQSSNSVFDWTNDDKIYEQFRKILLMKTEKWIQVIETLENQV